MFEFPSILAVIGIDDIIIYAFWYVAVPMAIAFVIGELSKKSSKPPSVDPDDLDAPMTDEGTKYTINFGTNWIENPIVGWWGDVIALPMVRHYSVNKWFNNKRVYYTIGHRYGMGTHEILCQGQSDGVKQIKVDKVVAWPNALDPTALQADGVTGIVIDEPNLFGGDESGGGVVGSIIVQYGGNTQLPAAYLLGELGADISATRGMTAIIKEQVLFGTSPYPRSWAYLIKRTTILTDGSPQWYAAKATINTLDMNPAHILRECYTNQEWGFQHSTGLFDDAVWQAFADTLYTEGFGMSIKWEDQNQTLEQFVKEILRHIDGKIYQDMVTGMFVPKLARYDYVVGDLEEFGDADVEGVEDFTRGAMRRVPNAFYLTYWNRQNNKPISTADHDLALVNAQSNKIVPYDVKFIGVMNDALAGKLLARERQQLGSFCATMKVKGKRSMSGLRPYDVFKLTSSVHGFSQMVVRILQAKYGTLSQGYVSFLCIQDVFSIQTALYSTPPTSGWTDPIHAPAAAPARLIREAPFWDIYQDAGLSEALALDTASGFLRVVASKPSNDTLDYELLLRDSLTGSFYSDGRGFFTPCGTLAESMPLNAADMVVSLSDVEGLDDVEVGSYAVIENEIVKVKAVNTTTNEVTLARGCLDTVPEYHAGEESGGQATIWFAGTVSYISGREFTDTNQPGVKILPRTSRGQLADDTAYNAAVFDSRMNRPYPPGDFKVDNVSYPTGFTGQPTISWKHRDRTQQLTEIVEHSAVSVGPEVGVTYTLKIYDENNILVRTETGLTGTSYTYLEEDEIADCIIESGGALNSSLRFVLTSVRDGYDSWQSYDLRVNRV